VHLRHAERERLADLGEHLGHHGDLVEQRRERE
jgi:hypothetical protein